MLTYGYLLVWIGILFMMANIKVRQHRELDQKNSLPLQDISLSLQLHTSLDTI